MPSARSAEPIRVGLVGAGPWAKSVHAPGLADHPGTTLTAVWSRRKEAAEELGHAHGAQACADFDELLGQVEAVAFAVPPVVQAELAVVAAKAGKHVILEKPLAPDVPAAERLADVISGAGVASLMMLTLRYAIETRDWLAALAATGGWTGGGARWLSGALLGGQYSGSPWRHETGALADIGPHALDLLDAALGPIVGVVAASRTPADLWHLILAHEGGATSSATLSVKVPVTPSVVDIAVYGQHGYRALGRKPGGGPESYIALLDDFAAMIATGTTAHPCDVQRGLHLQRLLGQALLCL
ncbi:MAG TPA: Gfo/Idh/MocA family oxidoreductase [Amycolatopsis sp.]|uniref:Gfo/Idh/MocA family protein n=1 Tax=Amycolatopsis sp. TaxID=37632 RepID=UPI002B472379|nr:Gfo/Idh/MocA family oxidoreductase [Amycolatopsis sp.]HKS46239.1 Gfo/Idh/MocA family oxidoreductase [Amycolatopsis sp.]